MTLREFLIGLATLILLSRPSPSAGADFSFDASVDRTEATLGETITLTLSVSGKDVPSNLEPKLPALEDFALIGQSRSSSTSITIDGGGRMSSVKTVSLVYGLSPRKEGSLTIGSAKMTVGGTTYSTQPISVLVTRGAGSSASPSGPFRTPGPPSAGRRSPGTGEDLFVRASVDPHEVYVGQQLTLTYELVTRYQLSEVNYDKVPSFSGFWTEQIFDAQRLNYERRVVGGKTYNVALLKKIALFPTAEGKYTLDPLQLRCEVRVSSSWGGLFDGFLGSTESVGVSSDPVHVRVMPLPLQGRPPGFSGGVGQFTIAMSAGAATAKQGDPLTLVVTISGKGNVSAAGDPVLPDLSSFKVYDPKVTKKSQNMGSVVGGTRTLEYILMPLSAGNCRIGPVSFSYFDPLNKAYSTVYTKAVDLKVLPGTSSSPLRGMAGLTKEEIKLVGEDIRFIKPDRSSLATGTPHYHQRTGLFVLCFILPAALLVCAAAYSRYLEKTEADPASSRRRRAKGSASRRLRKASLLLDERAPQEVFYAEIHKALVQYLADKLGLPAAGVVTDTIGDRLSEAGVSTDVVLQIQGVLRICDEARFSPLEGSEGKTREAYDLAESIISTLEKQI